MNIGLQLLIRNYLTRNVINLRAVSVRIVCVTKIADGVPIVEKPNDLEITAL